MPDPITPDEIARYYKVQAPGVRQFGKEWRGPCPLHQGKRHSFAINPRTGEWFCHSECVRCQIIWAKNTFAWGFGRYKFQHEPIFYCHIAQQKDSWYGDKSQSTLWQENKPVANRIHPTAKPVELIERAFINSSKAGDIVVDLFGGSGSTLIGCERRNRRVRLMEIDPKYADCIVRRYQEYTGKAALLNGDGRTFSEVGGERLTKVPA